jgi:ubiquinone/menaquinone biosynthesis C-methylase UbiE
MAQFARQTFNANNYASFRPIYPPHLYTRVLNYVGSSSPRKIVVDLGCGPGIVTRPLSKHYESAIGIDPSASMVKSAEKETPKTEYPSVSYKQGNAESLTFVEDSSVDLVVAGQAAHWFNLDTIWDEMNRILKPKTGILAFWGYKDPVFVGHKRATEILDQYAYGKGDQYFGDCWQQPGRSRVQNKLRDLIPPEKFFTDIQRVEYEPDAKGKRAGEGEVLMEKSMSLGVTQNYLHTWSSVHKWKELHPERKSLEEGGPGDVVDDLFRDIVESEEEWRKLGDGWKDASIDMEWGSGILFAKKK